MSDKLFKEIGKTGLKRNGGYVQEEFLPELTGARWQRIVKEMVTNDPIIHSVHFAIEMLVKQVSWDLKAASDSNRDKENAEFIKGALFQDMSHTWSETVAEIISFLPYGWSWMETVYKRRSGDNEMPSRRSNFNDGKIGWRKWAIRSQDSLFEWDFDEEGGVQGMIQMPPPNYEVIRIPIEKSLHFKTSSAKGNPEGDALTRHVYRPYFFKQRHENIEGIGVERDLAGLPIGRLPAKSMMKNASDADREMYSLMKKIVANIKRDENEGLVLPSDMDEKGNYIYDIKLLNTGGTRQFDTDKVINRYNRDILIAYMADFLMLGHEKVGSFALSSDKTDLFAVALGSFLDTMTGTINRHAIPRLQRLNGRGNEPMPELIHGDIESVDLGELGDFVTKLSGIDVRFSDEEIIWLKKQVKGMPVTEDAPQRKEMPTGKPKEMNLDKTPEDKGDEE